jgi:hypothetical protein
VVTSRDQDIFNFLEEFHIASANQIQKLFFNNKTKRYSRLRLEYLYNQGHLKRTRSTVDNCYAYYLEKKPVQIHHDLVRSELFVNLKNRYTILDWSNESPVVNIRPDAVAYFQNNSFAYIKDHGIEFPVFIEIHLNNKFNFDKYQELIKKVDLRSIFDNKMPRVIICTDRQVTVPNIGIKFKVVGINMKGIESIFK